MDAKMRFNNKKAQMAIFIIAGIAVIALIVLFFLIKGNLLPTTTKNIEREPQKFLDNCLKPKIKEKVDILLKNGGYLSNSLNFTFDNKSMAYLCYNQNDYFPCINQKPLLLSDLKQELHKGVSKDAENCFEEYKKKMEGLNYEIKMGSTKLNETLTLISFILDIEKSISINSKGSSSSYKNFEIVYSTRLYELASLAQEIVSQEAEFCNFDSMGYMMLYPEIKIEKIKTDKKGTIYFLTNKKTNEKFAFAVRGCILPGGI